MGSNSLLRAARLAPQSKGGMQLGRSSKGAAGAREHARRSTLAETHSARAADHAAGKPPAHAAGARRWLAHGTGSGSQGLIAAPDTRTFDVAPSMSAPPNVRHWLALNDFSPMHDGDELHAARAVSKEPYSLSSRPVSAQSLASAL